MINKIKKKFTSVKIFLLSSVIPQIHFMSAKRDKMVIAITEEFRRTYRCKREEGTGMEEEKRGV